MALLTFKSFPKKNRIDLSEKSYNSMVSFTRDVTNDKTSRSNVSGTIERQILNSPVLSGLSGSISWSNLSFCVSRFDPPGKVILRGKGVSMLSRSQQSFR